MICPCLPLLAPLPTLPSLPVALSIVLALQSALTFERLPATTVRPAGYERVALASAAFDASDFVSGVVRLVPGAVKDEESTHTCTQVFVVTRCQPKALQVDIATRAFLLSPGDHFYVPQATLYRMANHSKDTEAEIAFTVLKPQAAGVVGAMAVDEGQGQGTGAQQADGEAEAAGGAAAADTSVGAGSGAGAMVLDEESIAAAPGGGKAAGSPAASLPIASPARSGAMMGLSPSARSPTAALQ